MQFLLKYYMLLDLVYSGSFSKRPFPVFTSDITPHKEETIDVTLEFFSFQQTKNEYSASLKFSFLSTNIYNYYQNNYCDLAVVVNL